MLGTPLLLVLSVLSGCVGPRSSSPASPIPILKGTLADKGALSKELEEARRIVESGDQTRAIPRLVHVISKYPNSDVGAEAHYWLGVAFYKSQSYRDAIDMFKTYQELRPNGRYAAQSKAYTDQLVEEYEKKFMTAEALEAQVQEVAGKLRNEPGNLDLQMQLADLLCKRGDYQKAGEIYDAIAKANPNYPGMTIIAERVEYLTNGEYVLLTPVERQRRYIKERPLEVVNTTSFQSNRGLITREHQYYVVTGQVINRGESVLYGVQVVVTIFGFGNVVWDTNTVSFGRMNPGESRAFSVRFTNFPNIDDINRYEVVPTFQR